MQAREAAATAAHAAGDAAGAVREMDAAVAIEDSIDSLSQPPYPIIPAHELDGLMLMDMGRPAEAASTSRRRCDARLAGPRRSSDRTGGRGDRDTAAAREHYTRLIEMWTSADHDRPELQAGDELGSAGA